MYVYIYVLSTFCLDQDNLRIHSCHIGTTYILFGKLKKLRALFSINHIRFAIILCFSIIFQMYWFYLLLYISKLFVGDLLLWLHFMYNIFRSTFLKKYFMQKYFGKKCWFKTSRNCLATLFDMATLFNPWFCNAASYCTFDA